MKIESHGEKLINILKNEMPRFSRKAVADDLGITTSVLYKLFKKEKFSKAEIALVHLLFNIPTSTFDMPNSAFSTQLEGWNYGENNIDIITINSTVKSPMDSDIKNYLEKVVDILRSAKQNVKVVNLLSAHRDHSSTYAQSKYQLYYDDMVYIFKNILVENPNFKYTRILQLPFWYFGILRPKIDDIRSILHVAISLMSVEKFEHLINCFHELDSAFQLRVMKDLIRPSSYMLIDENISVTEFYRYDKNKQDLPNILYIDRINSHSNNNGVNHAIKSMHEEFDFFANANKSRFATSSSRAITIDLFRDAFYGLLDIQQEIVEDIRLINKLSSKQKIKDHYDPIATVNTEDEIIIKKQYTISKEHVINHGNRELLILEELLAKKELLEQRF